MMQIPKAKSLLWKFGLPYALILLLSGVGLLILLQKEEITSVLIIFSIFYVLLVLFFILGVVIFWIHIRTPIQEMIKTLEQLSYNPDHIDLTHLEKEDGNDEISILRKRLVEILKNFRTLQNFKNIIENDETVEEIYFRLAEALKECSFSSFVIYELSNSQDTMRPVYKSDESLDVNSEKLFNANKCRAKRTGKIVTSFEAPHICPLYEYQDITNYYCIPITTGNKVLGVVEIHLPLTYETLRDKKLLEKLNLAKSFIEATAPVIESKRYAEALKEQSFKDPLTGLYNRRFLESILDNLVAQILRRGTVLGILMCDMDFFKSINDKYGHDVGDLILKETAQILQGGVRRSDFVIRFGGEEFLVLLLDIREGEAERIAEKLRKNVELHEFKTPKGIIRRTISIGVSEFPADSSSIWEAIKFADIALYKAKEGGRNRVVKFRREFWSEEEY